MSDTANPLSPTTVTDGDWVVDSNSIAFPTTPDAIRADLADSAAMPALQVDENGDEINKVITPSAKKDAAVDAFAQPADGETVDAPAPKAEAKTAPKAAAPAEAAKPKKQSHEQRIAEINARIAERIRVKHETEARQVQEDRRQAESSQDEDSPAAPTTRTRVERALEPGSGNEDLLAGKPKWSAFDKAGKTYEEFEAAEEEWLARTFAVVQQRAQGNDTRTLEAVQHRERVTVAKAKYADFEEKKAALVGVPASPFLENLITRNAAGMDVLYHLGAHRDEAELLAALTHEANDPNKILPQLFHTLQETGTDPVPVVSYLATHPEEAQALLDLSPRAALVKIGQILSTAGSGAKTSGPSGTPAHKPAIPFTPVDGGSSMRAGADDDPEPDDSPENEDAWFAWKERQTKRDRARG